MAITAKSATEKTELIKCAKCGKARLSMIQCPAHGELFWECSECITRCEKLEEHGRMIKTLGYDKRIKLKAIKQDGEE